LTDPTDDSERTENADAAERCEWYDIPQIIALSGPC
jgi:hypothetical protein